jgi:SAM-dependent methyltransferase
MVIANVEMAKAWDGDEGDQWAADADHYEASGPRYGQRLLDAAGLTATDRVLDVGCGTGRSTRDAAQLAADGHVLGVDLSSRMLEEARRRSRAAGVTNIDFLQADAQVHPFDAESFDVVISAFGGMFFADRVAAFRNIGMALPTGGRLAQLAWRSLAENDWLNLVRDALAMGRTLPTPPTGMPGPFGLADADGARAALADAGYTDVDFAAVDEPLWFGKDADAAWDFISRAGIVRGLTQDLEPDTKAAALAKLRKAVDDHETADGVLLDSAAWLITARRR